MEYNYGTDACDNCPQGFRTIRPKTERCVQCPNGQTTSHAGDNICFDNLGWFVRLGNMSTYSYNIIQVEQGTGTRSACHHTHSCDVI